MNDGTPRTPNIEIRPYPHGQGTVLEDMADGTMFRNASERFPERVYVKAAKPHTAMHRWEHPCVSDPGHPITLHRTSRVMRLTLCSLVVQDTKNP